jgi:hypothetical protein
VAKHDSNTIIKFVDDTTVVGLITVNDETAYREEATGLAGWCQDNNLSLNVTKNGYDWFMNGYDWFMNGYDWFMNGYDWL